MDSIPCLNTTSRIHLPLRARCNIVSMVYTLSNSAGFAATRAVRNQSSVLLGYTTRGRSSVALTWAKFARAHLRRNTIREATTQAHLHLLRPSRSAELFPVLQGVELSVTNTLRR